MTDLDRESALVREAIHALRAADIADAPELDAVLARTPSARVVDVNRMAAMAAAAAMLLAVGNVVRVALEPRFVVPAEVVALSSWRPMTDALLEGTRPDATGDTPLTASLLPIVHIDTTGEKTP